MTIFDEIQAFLKSVLTWIYTFAAFSIIFFTFGAEKVSLAGKSLWLPWLSARSFSVQVFSAIREDLLPAGVELVTTNPMSAFLTQVLLSILLGFMASFPVFVYKIVLYLRPALLPDERRALFWSLFGVIILFFGGAAFSYFFLIPKTFSLLYPYATVMGVVPFFSLDEFIYYVFGLAFAVGLMFLLPIFMTLLSWVGIIEPAFWLAKWRYASFFFLIFSAIITPDGTGVTMILLSLPLIGLYFLGYWLSRRVARGPALAINH